jgi:ATP phosphoribosyltransferase
MTGLTLAVPSKGRLEELTRDWFAQRGFPISRPGGARSYLGHVEGEPDITVRFY